MQVPTVRCFPKKDTTQVLFASRDERNRSSIFQFELSFDIELDKPFVTSKATSYLNYKDNGIVGSLGVFPGGFGSICGQEYLMTSYLLRESDGRLGSRIVAYKVQEDGTIIGAEPKPITILNEFGDETLLFVSTPTILNLENSVTLMWFLAGKSEHSGFPFTYGLYEARFVGDGVFKLTGREFRGMKESSCISKPSFIYGNNELLPARLMFSLRDEESDYKLAFVPFESDGKISKQNQVIDCQVVPENELMSCYGEYISLNNKDYVIFSGNHFGYGSLLIGDLISRSF
jgi:hypothetical protein